MRHRRPTRPVRGGSAGVSALRYDGADALTDEAIHIFVPKGATRRHLAGVVPHECRRWGAEDLERVRRHRFRRELQSVVLELAGGVRSVGELDVARRMRERGLPEPSRQSVRTRPSGQEYLDAEFDAYALVMEVEASSELKGR